MLSRSFTQLLIALTASTAVAALLLAGWAWREKRAFERYQKAISEVEVIVPRTSPAQNQESIETALTLFSIATPSTVDGPFYDANLEDRGLTTGGLLLPQKLVTVGPSAFTSWAVLGSTLAHELEVHVPQSFFLVVAQDHWTRWKFESQRVIGKLFPAMAPSAKELFENDGTWKAERDAYMHEIKNAKRFGLSQEELASIWRVMDYFYPSLDKETIRDAHLSASSENGGDALSEDDVKSSEL